VVDHGPDKEPGLFDSLCPVRNVTRDYPPALLLHRDKVTDVSITLFEMQITLNLVATFVHLG
jgi:hypothetical protein